MATRISHKVKLLKRRLLDEMLRQRDIDERDYTYYSVSKWVGKLNRRHRLDDEGDGPVTDPQIRRCMLILVEEEKVRERGYGRKQYQAIYLAERLAEADAEIKKAAKLELTARLHSLGLWAIDGYNERITVSCTTATALAEMLEDFPGIAEQYFVNEIEDQANGS